MPSIRFDADTIRFYLAHDGGINNDASYDNVYISQRYEHELQHNLGGLASRVLRSNRWKARHCVAMNATGQFEPWLGTYKRQFEFLEETRERAIEHMQNMDASAAVKEIIGLVHQTNVFLQQAQPWMNDPGRLTTIEDTPHRQERAVFLCKETLRLEAIMLKPFLPNYMARLFEMLGVAPDKQTMAHAVVGADSEYGKSTVSLVGIDGILFRPLLVTN